MSNKNVSPDKSLLKQIFSTDQPTAISIIRQNWDKCVFKAEFSQSQDPYNSAYIVRLESENENTAAFATIAAMQQVAARVLPKLVPRTYQVGKARNEQGRMFDFSVIALVDGHALEDVWHLLTAENQNSITK